MSPLRMGRGAGLGRVRNFPEPWRRPARPPAAHTHPRLPRRKPLGVPLSPCPPQPPSPARGRGGRPGAPAGDVGVRPSSCPLPPCAPPPGPDLRGGCWGCSAGPEGQGRGRDSGRARAGPAAPPPAARLRGWVGLLPWGAAAQLGCTPGFAHEKYITEKYRIWMKGGEAQRVTAPLSLSPPAGSRGLWEGLLRWHLRKFLLRDGCRLPELSGAAHLALVGGPRSHGGFVNF